MCDITGRTAAYRDWLGKRVVVRAYPVKGLSEQPSLAVLFRPACLVDETGAFLEPLDHLVPLGF